MPSTMGHNMCGNFRHATLGEPTPTGWRCTECGYEHLARQERVVSAANHNDGALIVGLASLPALVTHACHETQRWHQRGLSLSSIARECGLHRNTLAHWLAHPTEGRISTLLTVAAWLQRVGGVVP